MHRRATRSWPTCCLREGEAAAAIPLYRELLGVQPTSRAWYAPLPLLPPARRPAGADPEEAHLRAILEKRAAEAGDASARAGAEDGRAYQRILAELATGAARRRWLTALDRRLRARHPLGRLAVGV